MHILRSRTNDNAAAEIELVVTRHNTVWVKPWKRYKV